MFSKALIVLAFVALCPAPMYVSAQCTTIAQSVADGGFTTLGALVEAVGLTERFNDPASETPYTIFAPTDAAFANSAFSAVDPASLTDDEKTVVTRLLLLHVVEGAYDAAAIVAGDGPLQTLLPEGILVSDGETVTYADTTANIIDADAVTMACGGSVIHVIDSVLGPPPGDTTESPSQCTTIVQSLSDEGFTILGALVEAVGFTDTFNDPASDTAYTIFAPTDDAFAIEYADLDPAALTEDQRAAVTRVLSLHVVQGAYDAATIVAGGATLQTLLTQPEAMLTSDGVTVSYNETTATITKADAVTMACGGSVVHVIDTVLVPPPADTPPADTAGTDSPDMPSQVSPPAEATPPGTPPPSGSWSTSLVANAAVPMATLLAAALIAL